MGQLPRMSCASASGSVSQKIWSFRSRSRLSQGYFYSLRTSAVLARLTSSAFPFASAGYCSRIRNLCKALYLLDCSIWAFHIIDIKCAEITGHNPSRMLHAIDVAEQRRPKCLTFSFFVPFTFSNTPQKFLQLPFVVYRSSYLLPPHVLCPDLLHVDFSSERRTTVSTCTVWGNISTARHRFNSYPPFVNTFRSLASVALLQLTYTILSGFIASIVCWHFSSQPFRGGSTTITSARI